MCSWFVPFESVEAPVRNVYGKIMKFGSKGKGFVVVGGEVGKVFLKLRETQTTIHYSSNFFSSFMEGCG